MTTSRPTKLVVTKAAGARQALSDLVMAWARDTLTGAPRYILELDEHHRGARCGCECPSCGLPLTAVNAAKAEFLRRPHFRHPDGSERSECMVLAARAAALRQLHQDGWLELPRRQIRGQVLGLSGVFHEAWVEQPAQRLRVDQVDYADRASAVFTFEDGRQLRVELTGTTGRAEDHRSNGSTMPVIYMAVDDPELASMNPEELRARLRLEATEFCWHSHWSDGVLQAQADAQARLRAEFYFDEVPPWLELPEDMDPALRRETVLHHEVKRILEAAGRVTVPKVEATAEVSGPAGKICRDQWVLEEEALRLSCVELETRFGRLVPDVTCEAFGDDGHARYLPLLIEVTVTNAIDEERLARIRAHREATLEIDLSMAGGRVNRDELRRLVVDEVAIKRWLFHPDQEYQRKKLSDGLTQRIADEEAARERHLAWVAQRKAQVLSTPVAELAEAYLDAVACMHETLSGSSAQREAREAVADAADKLAIHGYPEAGDENLLCGGGILHRLLCFRLGRAVGDRYDSLFGALRDIHHSSGNRVSTLTIYFIALKAYPPGFAPDQQAWLDAWFSEVRHSIAAGETTYLRDPAYDRLLSLLFPEMAAGLAKKGGKLASAHSLNWDPGRQMYVRPDVPQRRRARFLAAQPRADQAGSRLLDTKPGDWLLKGRDLEAWKRANPEWAEVWFPTKASFDGDGES